MTSPSPNLIILAGPNGAGKSTAAPFLLRDELAVTEFVNADVIAQGLSGFAAEGAAISAGRVMLHRIHDLARLRLDFAFETTLSSRSPLRWIRDAREEGYRIELVFLWLSGPDVAVARVLERVKQGGHSVPESTIRRRYHRGIENFFRLYMALADEWRFYDNSDLGGPRLVARGRLGSGEEVFDGTTWTGARPRG
jgi:predicted ABC-type ATPase